MLRPEKLAAAHEGGSCSAGAAVNLFIVDRPESRRSTCARDRAHLQNGSPAVRGDGTRMDPEVCGEQPCPSCLEVIWLPM